MNPEAKPNLKTENVYPYFFHPDEFIIAREIAQSLTEHGFGTFTIAEENSQTARGENDLIPVLIHTPVRNGDPLWEIFYPVASQVRHMRGTDEEISDMRKSAIQQGIERLKESRKSIQSQKYHKNFHLRSVS